MTTHQSCTPAARALLALPNGDLITAGRFDAAGGISARQAHNFVRGQSP